jgi:hypothetical protein
MPKIDSLSRIIDIGSTSFNNEWVAKQLLYGSTMEVEKYLLG